MGSSMSCAIAVSQLNSHRSPHSFPLFSVSRHCNTDPQAPAKATPMIFSDPSFTDAHPAKHTHLRLWEITLVWMLIFIVIWAEMAKGFSDSWDIGILKALWMLNINSLIGGGLWTHKNQSVSITLKKVQIFWNKLQILCHWRLGNYGNKSI